jgi:hypothetical protein
MLPLFADWCSVLIELTRANAASDRGEIGEGRSEEQSTPSAGPHRLDKALAVEYMIKRQIELLLYMGLISEDEIDPTK